MAAKDFRPQQAKAARGLVTRLLDGPDDVVKAIRQMSGEIIMSKQADSHFSKQVWIKEEDVKSVAGTMYQAGSDTMAVTIASCILALLEHPDVMKKAQQEIDSVVFPGNYPEFRDEESLPYITAIVKEILRWQVITPFAVPHSSNIDDIFNGYLIPAGSTLIPNVWAILHDEKVFPDPELFVPERFMKYDEVSEARLEIAWGYGRRVCSGRYMAFSTVWITLASILAVYDISKPLDKNGHVIESSREYSSSLLP
ncbi:cytochrome P450 [Cyathus striatus]|nr:cytochrome P450 [Cyathus striatus]